MASNITSANAVLALTIPLILPVPVVLHDFSVEDIFTTTPVVPTEIQMSIDGNLAGGFVFVEKRMEIALQASSDSNSLFDSWNAQQEALLAAFPAQGVLTLPALGMGYVLVTGFLTRYPPIADARRVLQARRYEVTWSRIIGAPIGLTG